MPATLIDGTGIAKEVQKELAAEVEQLGKKGVRPGLAVVLVGEDPASASYVGMKARACERLGVYSRKVELPETTSTDELLAVIGELNRDHAIDGILVQLPLPAGIEKARILEAVDPAKDVDGFHSSNIGSLVLGHSGLVACTPLGIMELLGRTGVSLDGANAVVLGRSDDVGKPMALLLLHANATVTICHSHTRDIEARTREADVVVAAVGRAGMVGKDALKPGAVVIDVGSNKLTERSRVVALFGEDSPRVADFDERGYVWVGDVDERDVMEVAGWLTPVPGGVGPMTIAMLLRNTLTAACRRRGPGC
jgi:methylenetetrahydrofolate dehydrogenase (NADP+)/methenyltetrahydrofolate cyclohydrolase